jgi:putative glutamine amidotransferase
VLAICRGLQIANVQAGGTITAHLDRPHRHVLSTLALEPGTELAKLVGVDQLTISSYHHQRVDRLGRGLRPVAVSADGTVEAVERDGPDWFVGVQWHPEDTADSDPHQARLFSALVAAAGPAMRR